MANKIQIKRSTTNAAPAGLANGELAYTSNGEILFLGHPDGSTGSIAIGGRRVPGTLTANQALVANATSGIDKVIVANLVPTAIYANGSVGTDGQVLASNGTVAYWLSPSAGVTYDLLAVANTEANKGILQLDPSTGANDDVFFIGAGGVTVSSNSTAILITGQSGDITEVVAGNGLTDGGTSGSVTLNVGAGAGITVAADSVAVNPNNGIIANSSGVFADAANGISVDASGINVLRGDGTLTVNATGVYVNTANLSVATSQLSGDVALGTQTSGNYVATISAGAGISGSGSSEGSAVTIAVVANNGIISNTSGVFADAANGISVDASGINVTAGDGLVANATGVHVVAANGISVSADAVGVTTGSTLTVNTSGIHVNSSLSITDLTLSGNLDINGTLTTVDTTNLSVTDSIISLARSNAVDTLDIGFYGTFNDGATKYSGLFRDASDGTYKLFAGQIPEPTTTVDTANVNFAFATLRSFLNTGALIANSSVVNITANSTVSVALTANSLSLTTALPATSGGTGQSTYAVGDLLVGGATNTLAKLTVGTDGKVLQSNGTSVVYADLDGGTF
jgi:hypothetical protein